MSCAWQYWVVGHSKHWHWQCTRIPKPLRGGGGPMKHTKHAAHSKTPLLASTAHSPPRRPRYEVHTSSNYGVRTGTPSHTYSVYTYNTRMRYEHCYKCQHSPEGGQAGARTPDRGSRGISGYWLPVRSDGMSATRAGEGAGGAEARWAVLYGGHDTRTSPPYSVLGR